MPIYTIVAAPGSINSKRITVKPAREGFVSMCACTEPVRTGIVAVCVEYGRPKWPITMLNHTNRHPWYRIMFVFFLFLAPYVRTTRYEEAFLLKDKKRARSLRSLGLASLLVIGGNEARPTYPQLAICDASWRTGACILSSVVGAPKQKRRQR